ncbi:triple tyrosine motif-containing protein [Lacihabitans sp. LS3-19]|uniref:helix-turn-helix and ligand-binding sensor domain-containing protein n=1 Tax=Lacihabitans sp. LS3-19 TaxID=2487335 RepID=UPI0020CFD5A1|nr:triple tyrosine motif-containing protein [Lacihabitans sp. LS3-19]
MYFANSKGLLEYDGSRWRLFASNQTLRSVLVDRKGRIFTGALGEFGEWKRNEKGDLKYNSLKAKIGGKEFKEESIWNIVETEDGILFQSFAFAYLYISDGSIKPLKVPSNIHFFNNVFGDLFVPGIDNGVFRLKKGVFEEIPDSKAFFKNHAYAALLASDEKDKQLWVGTSKGVFKQTKDGFLPLNAELNAMLNKYKLNKAVKIKDGWYAFGTLLNGILICNEKGEVKYHLNKNNGLGNNTVLALNVDAEGNLWAGLDNGISLIQLANPLKFYQDISGDIGAVYDGVVFQNHLYIGSNHGLFVKEGDKFVLVPNTQGQVWQLNVFEGQLICGHNDGTFLIDNKQAKKISDVTGGWVTKQLDKNTLLQGTYTRMVLFRKDGAGKWTFSKIIENSPESVKEIEIEKNNTVWIKRVPNQILKLQLTNDYDLVKNRTFFEFPNVSYVNISYFQNQLLATTSSNVYRFDLARKKFLLENSFPRQQSVVKFFKSGNKEALALNSNGLLSTWKQNKLYQASYFDSKSFIDGSEQIKALNEEHLMFCLEEGFAIGNYRQLFNFEQDKIVKEGFGDGAMVSGFFLENSSELNQNFEIGKDKAFTFSNKNKAIGFWFKPNSYSQSAQFSYKLEGLNNNWSAYQTENFKVFNSLSAGKYTLFLKANFSDKISTFQFEILPPWYWNGWSKIGYFLMFLGLVYLLNFLHERRLKKHQEKLEELHRQRVEHKQQEIVMLRNEQLEKDIIRKSEELANSTMVLIKKNELLSQIKEEVTDKVKEKSDSILRLIEKNISTNSDWKVFESNFNQVHESFLKKLQQDFPMLSHGDLKLAAYLRMNLSTKEIAQLLNITARSVELKRYRLRKKLNITSDENLNDLMMRI